MVRRFTTLFVLAVAGFVCLTTQDARAQAAPNNTSVLILEGSVTGGSSSLEAVAAANLGYTVVVANDATWASMSAADFASYRAIVVGDPTCVYGESAVDGAINTGSVWGPELDGNIVIIGTDPVFHATQPGPTTEQEGAAALIEKAMAFVLSTPISADRTGAYLSLGCAHDPLGGGSTGNVALLDYVGNGDFTVEETDCHNDAHITAFHPALDGLTDADLSDWGCSVHSIFTTWDSGMFEVLAIGDNLGDSYTDEDGSVGSPYILAAGVCNSTPTITVSLNPTSFWPPNNQMGNVAATVNVTGDNTTVELVSITSDEGDEINDVAGAATGTADYAFQLRKQRDGSGDGRVYTVTYKVTDECGHVETASATVTVAHDSGN
jgi:hypothetical protein